MELLVGSMSFNHYRSETLSLLSLRDAIPSLLKTIVFGYLIGLTGCYCGMNAPAGTEELQVLNVRYERIRVESFSAPPGAEAVPKPLPRTGTGPLRPVTDPE